MYYQYRINDHLYRFCHITKSFEMGKVISSSPMLVKVKVTSQEREYIEQFNPQFVRAWWKVN